MSLRRAKTPTKKRQYETKSWKREAFPQRQSPLRVPLYTAVVILGAQSQEKHRKVVCGQCNHIERSTKVNMRLLDLPKVAATSLSCYTSDVCLIPAIIWGKAQFIVIDTTKAGITLEDYSDNNKVTEMRCCNDNSDSIGKLKLLAIKSFR